MNIYELGDKDGSVFVLLCKDQKELLKYIVEMNVEITSITRTHYNCSIYKAEEVLKNISQPESVEWIGKL